MKYIILQHDSAIAMQQEVQSYLDLGWRLSGGLFSHNGFMHQAMHKED